MACFGIIGINHKTAPIHIREKLFLWDAEKDFLLSELKHHPAVVEALVLSTCNRTEIYLRAIRGIETIIGEVLESLFDIKAIDSPGDIRKYFYVSSEEEAVRHLLRVSSGLDSLILGEDQILWQVKEAVDRSRRRGMLGKFFNILSNFAIRTGKKARHETKIARGGSSIGWAGVRLAEKILGGLENKKALVIGAGKMGELVIGQLKKKDLKSITLINRSEDRAKELAKKYGIRAFSFCDLKEALLRADLCVTATAAPYCLIEQDAARKILEQKKTGRLLFIDISLPRCIDPRVASVNGAELKAIDDLREVVEENIGARISSIEDVEEIIRIKVDEFKDRVNKISAVDSRRQPAIAG